MSDLRLCAGCFSKITQGGRGSESGLGIIEALSPLQLEG